MASLKPNRCVFEQIVMFELLELLVNFFFNKLPTSGIWLQQQSKTNELIVRQLLKSDLHHPNQESAATFQTALQFFEGTVAQEHQLMKLLLALDLWTL